MAFYGYLLTAFVVFRQGFCAADPLHPSVPEAPALVQTSVTGSSVKLLCRAPQGSGGLKFQLFKVQQLVDTVTYSSKQREASFVLTGKDINNENNENLYCCRYENSMYSSYIKLEIKTRASVNPPPSPHLAVQPASDHIMPGQTLSFHCQAPPAYEANHRPEAFFLIRRARGTQGSRITPPRLVSQSQRAHFSVKMMGREDSGEYVCLYQITMPKMGRVNSTASLPVHISVIDLPVPTLSLSQHGGDVLECVGSPAYPQASFSLFRVGSLIPEDSRQFSLIQHRARFPLPDRYEHGSLYQCQYTLLLGNSHVYSKMSNPVSLQCIQGHHCTPSSAGRADLPLIIGSASAAVLFLMIISLLSFVIHRHIKTVAEKRRKREQEKLWQKIHSRDHIIDLPLQRVDYEVFDPAFRGRASSVSEPIYDRPLTSFTNPTLV